MLRLLQPIVSWLAVGYGLLLGSVCFIVSGDAGARVHDPARWPDFVPAVCGVLLGLTMVLASFLALRKRRSAGLIFAGTAIAFGALRAWRDPFPENVDSFLGPVLFFGVPGLFWLSTSECAPLLRTRPRVWIAPLMLTLVLAASVVSSFQFVAPHLDDCYHPRTLGEPFFPGQVVFTGKVVFRGPPAASDPQWSSWSLVRVERLYGGLPRWAPGWVLLRYPIQAGSREYLVDGRHSKNFLLHFFPVIEPYECCHLCRLDRAVQDLRVLNGGRPRHGVRLVGSVLEAPYSSDPVPGIDVQITGPGGVRHRTTDQQGIFEETELPAGHYRVELGPGHPNAIAEKDLRTGEVWTPRLVAPSR